MKKSMVTKKKIADAFKELMVKNDFEKLTTTDITTYANIRRQTFYNHFKDKYDLIIWIFENELEQQITHHLHNYTWKIILTQLLKYIDTRQEFYSKVFLILGQNNFDDFFTEQCHYLLEMAIKEKKVDITPYLKQSFIMYNASALSKFIKSYCLIKEPLAYHADELIIFISSQLNDLKHTYNKSH
ncbi:dihydroxyacetone kinase transcriptional activator DhaS [Granulicatella sp. zg-ZJ]|uniref:dihydroxyacetone kinase transcriptional activator DhaS n=1 Tax=unclassified Granulicatella TaxID=2630493 RepID=UPI0013BF1071|nr:MULTISPECIES: dihydroxyacetone kinase transcriptional activator DhaS [unclassified Granulicatella]MBS4751142.1 dihydroxyacetone kinase transcriptional activator DhaS [Carnobacteriaceae bacterium zg-ZUI78]NEW62329.1 dihydroxyacetone kinase transcriptional activator DhaS [Granulicatella sp. zg-ZJ]NEW65532.1 dihydroxyacetone kinase transcriptional activator DhaS [Granulicatella sp. zg-84]QMI85584.1 dihydroxyacetone kinase transcriptional activator DhaS [Carnobacteriaceae bacterium zg-84]